MIRFSIGKQKFACSIGFTALVLFIILIMLKAGFWQLDRARQKVVLQQAHHAAIDKPALEGLSPSPRFKELRFRKAVLQGEYIKDKQFLLDNRVAGTQQQKRIGYEVLTPFRLDDGYSILVNRGWVPASAQREQLPDVAIDANITEIMGVINIPERGFRLGGIDSDQAWPRRIQYINYSEISERVGESVYPAVIMLMPDQPAAYKHNWQPVFIKPSKHYAYAVQWFAMVVALIVLFIFASADKKTKV